MTRKPDVFYHPVLDMKSGYSVMKSVSARGGRRTEEPVLTGLPLSKAAAIALILNAPELEFT